MYRQAPTPPRRRYIFDDRKLESFQIWIMKEAMAREQAFQAAAKPAKPRPGAAATAPQAAPRPKSADAAKMLALIAAAEDIFLAKGYHTATMSDVAKAAGMSKKTVYQLIDSKAELFANLLAHYQSLFSFPNPAPGATAETILFDNLTALAKYLLSPDQISIIRLIMAEYTHSPNLGRILHQNRFKKAKSKLETCLLDIAVQGNFKIENASEMSAMLFGMAIGEFHLSVLVGFKPTPTKTALESRIRQAVNIFLTGCGCGLGK
jgi:TetR/AcrR family transcriptional repressor of mexJK operon